MENDLGAAEAARGGSHSDAKEEDADEENEKTTVKEMMIQKIGIAEGNYAEGFGQNFGNECCVG